MTTPHPHKDILIAIANGFPIEQVESQHKTWKKDSWARAKIGSGYVSWLFAEAAEWKVRIKQKTIMFNGIELPEPLMEEPERGTYIYIPDPLTSDNYTAVEFNTYLHMPWLKQGLLHASKENAIAWAKAMMPFPQNT